MIIAARNNALPELPGIFSYFDYTANSQYRTTGTQIAFTVLCDTLAGTASQSIQFTADADHVLFFGNNGVVETVTRQ